MPTVYVTYHDPHADALATVPVETTLSFRVFRAACLVEGVELPGGRAAVLPAAIRLVSLDPPPAPAAAAPGAAIVVSGQTLRPTLPAPAADEASRAAMRAGDLRRPFVSVERGPGGPAPAPADEMPALTTHPQPPAGAPAGGGAAAPRRRPKR